ncbi:helix-turn-helix domain-containing protein [Priestia megaterium]|nr:helix-turn-helix domain-containing protein [Priestia megaterium]PEE74812.1 helix-turn-helix domain-containing protein [Priestia megaterium]PFI97593.1 helix-turn-helix domain-containing protein [Priestia megaterium]PGR13623.1 helix-turn-helix domain-containing protein [Priestia megaterium]
MTELGQRLRQERESKGLSLEDLQKLTKIQKRYLLGIEEGNYEVMPGKFYVRAFIKQYCEAIGLDTDAIFEEYKSDIPSTQTEDMPQQLSRVRSRKEIPQHTKGVSKAYDYLPTVLVVAGVVVVGIIIWVIAQNIVSDKNKEQANQEAPNSEVQQSNTQEETNETTAKNDNSKSEDEQSAADKKEQEKEKAEKEKVAKEKAEKEKAEKEKKDSGKQEYKEVQKTGRSATYALSGTDAFNLEVTSTQADTWLDVKNGKGNAFFSSILKKGETKEFDLTKETEARVNIGYSPGVELKVNGKAVDLPFDSSKQVRQVVTIQYQPAEAQ